MPHPLATLLVPALLVACNTTSTTPAHVDAAAGGDAPDGAAASCNRRVVVDFEGPALTQGASDDAVANRSDLVATSRTVPKFRAGDGARASAIAAILVQVRATLNVYPIDVLTTRPASGDYQLVVVTETDTDLGLAAGSAPQLYDQRCPADASAPKAVGFVFEQAVSGTVSSGTQVANRIIQAIGGMNRVPWSNLQGDCMCGDGDNCGAVECEIGGNVAGFGACGTSSFNEADAFGAITSC